MRFSPLAVLRCYEQLGYGYARHFFTVSATYTSVPDDNCLVVSLESLPDTKTYYTLDGSQPTKGAFLYENPLRIDKSCVPNYIFLLVVELLEDCLHFRILIIRISCFFAKSQ
ncbi:FN3 associated domain-containing protein [Bacteroides sp.]|uniref:FN3 associated domain-containing protein n=1 Tax=Bacteroides sp. TaxID=29523 RepID=UPI0040263E9A